jgi:endonuclease G
MPNSQSVNEHNWDYYRLSVDELEVLTGYDFLSSLPVALQATLEAKTDDQPI